MTTRIAYMPLNTYPEAVPDQAILAAIDFAAKLGCSLHVSVFSVKIPQLYSPMGGLLLDVPSLVHGTEERSKAECRRLEALVNGAARPGLKIQCRSREIMLGAALDVAAGDARYFDLAVLPWTGETVSAQDLSEAVVFGSGRPTVLVPPTSTVTGIDHVAIAWDASRFAARALYDALPYLAEGGRVSVLTVKDEKPLSGADLARNPCVVAEDTRIRCQVRGHCSRQAEHLHGLAGRRAVGRGEAAGDGRFRSFPPA